MKKHQQGSALLSASFLAVTAVGLLFVVSGNWILQNGLSSTAVTSDGARRLAESAVQVVAARLQKKPDTTIAELPSIALKLPTYPGGTGQVSLDPAQAETWNIPLSVNNLTGDKSVKGWGDTVVAQETANLVAVGRYRGVEYRNEVVLYVPSFPYVVASSVPLKSLNGLDVFGISGLEALTNGFSAVPAELRRPGHISTNAGNYSDLPSLQLLGNSHIEGDAQSHGEVLTQSATTVSGEIRSFANQSALPTIKVESLDTASQPGVNALSAPSMNGPSLAGFNRASQSLTVTGGLKLDNAVLFVDGDLDVSGGIQGKGAVIVTGKVKVEGGSALTGDSQSAILARGAITLRGTAGQRSEYRGLIYTEGNLDCKYANIAGSIVVNNPDPAGSAHLEEVGLIETKDLAVAKLLVKTQVAIPDSSTPGGPGTFPTAGLDTSKLPVDSDGKFYVSQDMRDNPLNYASLPGGPVDPAVASQLAINLSGFMDILVEAANAGTKKVVIDYSHPNAPADETTTVQGQPGVTTTQLRTQEIIVPWTLDLNQFTKLSDRIRILSWRRT